MKADGKLQKQSYVPVAGFPVYTEKGGIVKRAETRASICLPRIAYSGTIAIPSTSVGPVSIEPALTLDAGFTPKFDYNIVFQFGRVKSIAITLHAKDILLDAHLLAYAGLEYAINLSDLYSIPVAPIVLGPTGLVLSPTISAGPYLSFSAGADIDVKLFHGEGEVSYVLTNPTQLPTWNFQIDPYGWENIKVYPQVASEVGLQVNTGFSLTYLMTNVASVNAAPKIGLGSTVSSNDNLQHVNHEIYGVLRADARLLLGVPPFQIEQNYPIINYQPVFYSKEYALFE